MADAASQILVSFEVYKPYIENGQEAPVIMLLLASGGDVTPTVLKTCMQPAMPVIVVDDSIAVLWTKHFDKTTGQCVAQNGKCIEISSDRTAYDRCPTAAYSLIYFFDVPLLHRAYSFYE